MKKLPDGGDDFIRLFVLYCLGNFIAPLQSRCVDLKMLRAVSDVSAIRRMDWCKFVLEQLLKGLESFHHSKSKSIGGCVFVLLIVFLQHVPYLGIPDPLDLPLIQHWTQEKVVKRKRCFENSPIVSGAYPLSRGGKTLNKTEEDEIPTAKLFGKFSMDIFGEVRTNEETAKLELNPAQEAFMLFRRYMANSFNKLEERLSVAKSKKEPGSSQVTGAGVQGTGSVVNDQDAVNLGAGPGSEEQPAVGTQVDEEMGSQEFFAQPFWQKLLDDVFWTCYKKASNEMPSFDLGIDKDFP